MLIARPLVLFRKVPDAPFGGVHVVEALANLLDHRNALIFKLNKVKTCRSSPLVAFPMQNLQGFCQFNLFDRELPFQVQAVNRIVAWCPVFFCWPKQHGFPFLETLNF